MRHLLFVLLLPALLCLPPALAQQNEAEKLFREMEKKIEATKAVQVTAEIEMAEKDRTAKSKGSLLFTKDNNARLKMSGKFYGDTELTAAIISNRKQWMAVSWNLQDTSSKALEKVPTPKKLQAFLSAGVSRVGLFAVFAQLGEGEPRGEKKKGLDAGFYRVEDFKGGAAEKVAGRDARVVSYNVTFGRRESVTVTLWIEAKALVPLKRVFPFENGRGRITEVYSEFNLDPKFDAKTFELPK